jgi:hypothetical protein
MFKILIICVINKIQEHVRGAFVIARRSVKQIRINVSQVSVQYLLGMVFLEDLVVVVLV